MDSTRALRETRRVPMEVHMMMAKVATGTGWVLYLVSVVVLEGLFLALTGQASEVSQLTLVASTLVIAVLLHPLRRRLRDYIDRRLRERGALRAAREAQGSPRR
jgi:hypothetical protein